MMFVVADSDTGQIQLWANVPVKAGPGLFTFDGWEPLPMNDGWGFGSAIVLDVFDPGQPWSMDPDTVVTMDDQPVAGPYSGVAVPLVTTPHNLLSAVLAPDRLSAVWTYDYPVYGMASPQDVYSGTVMAFQIEGSVITVQYMTAIEPDAPWSIQVHDVFYGDSSNFTGGTMTGMFS